MTDHSRSSAAAVPVDGAAPAGAARPVFLSYASQDAVIVRRLAEALRAAGVVVWFDQEELRGGDAWDALIRRRIRECALFVPVISPQTQARLEGYFRREWRLAIERMDDIADGVPFLVPVLLPGVTEPAALVPERFRTVQWTRLADPAAEARWVARVGELLAVGPGGGAAAGVAPALEPRVGGSAGPAGRRAPVPVSSFLWALLGLAFAGLWWWRAEHRPARRPAETPPVATVPAASATPATGATEAAGVAKPALEASRVAVARFENLTGDPALDARARLLESELLRALGAAPHVRVTPLEDAGRRAAREAARAAGAATVLLGNYSVDGDGLALTAELLLVEAGTVLGGLGPVTVPAGIRGPEFTEFLDRLTTGASNTVALLESRPRRLEALIYSRPWPRWSVAQQLTGVRAGLEGRTAETIAAYRQALVADPSWLKARHELARLLRDDAQVEEAETLLRSLLDEAGRLSQAERHEVAYDLALLRGEPETALVAARELLEIRPLSGAIMQVLACEWALNRPRAAHAAMQAWCDEHLAQLPPAAQSSPAAGLVATELVACLRHRDYERAAALVPELARQAGPGLLSLEVWMGAYTEALLGRMDGAIEHLESSLARPALGKFEPAAVALNIHGTLLHEGRPADAARLLAWARARLAGLPAETTPSPERAWLEVGVHYCAGEWAEASAAVERAVAAGSPDGLNVLATRALLHQAQGDLAGAQPLIERLERWELRNTRGMPLYWRARLAAQAGDDRRAVALLQQAVARGLWFADFRQGASQFGWVELEFVRLRGDPAYERLLRPAE